MSDDKRADGSVPIATMVKIMETTSDIMKERGKESLWHWISAGQALACDNDVERVGLICKPVDEVMPPIEGPANAD